jgi:acylphosphatase
MTERPETRAFFARVKGRVQGVGFRYTCYNEGRRLGLTGWVRNSGEGDVEVWAEGSAEKLERFVQWLHRGPAGARVDSVRLEQRSPTGSYRYFEIEH